MTSFEPTREDRFSFGLWTVGNVGRDPDVYETKKGTKVVHLSLATNRPPFGDEAEQRTDWHRLTLWAGLAQFKARVNVGGSDLSNLTRTSLGTAALAAGAGAGGGRPWWLYAVGLAVVRATVEWITWLRRITV